MRDGAVAETDAGQGQFSTVKQFMMLSELLQPCLLTITSTLLKNFSNYYRLS